MTKHSVQPPRFQARFLLPRFWPTWLMVGVLYLISWLPYRLQLMLGRLLGLFFLSTMKKRANICLRNLELAYPDMPLEERKRITKEVFKNSGIAIFETGMAWWWPDWRIKRIYQVKNLQLLQETLAKGHGVFGLTFHFLSLEMHARCIGLTHPSVGLYRPHNNPVMEYLQTKGRGRSNKYLLPKKNVRGMLEALEQGEVSLYLPDQDYGPRRAVFVPLFAVPDAATTTGTSIFANQPNAITLVCKFKRLPGAQGYLMEFKAPESAIPSGDDTEDAKRVNKELELAINENSEMYMWMHRRFKTRPSPDMESYYAKSERHNKKG